MIKRKRCPKCHIGYISPDIKSYKSGKDFTEDPEDLKYCLDCWIKKKMIERHDNYMRELQKI